MKEKLYRYKKKQTNRFIIRKKFYVRTHIYLEYWMFYRYSCVQFVYSSFHNELYVFIICMFLCHARDLIPLLVGGGYFSFYGFSLVFRFIGALITYIVFRISYKSRNWGRLNHFEWKISVSSKKKPHTHTFIYIWETISFSQSIYSNIQKFHYVSLGSTRKENKK